MKNIDHRHLIICLIVLFLIPVSLKLLYHPSQNTNPAITINKKRISQSELEKKLTAESCSLDSNALVNSIIMKEVLIQEAIKTGINKDKDFKQSIKNYYEQSLIKLLMDRKYSELNPKIDDALIKRYMELSDKKVDITVLTYKSLDDVEKNNPADIQKSEMLFINFSTFLKYTLLSLKQGESSKPILSESEPGDTEKPCTVFKLNHISDAKNKVNQETDTEMIETLLIEQEKELLISKWLDELKNNATINFSKKLAE